MQRELRPCAVLLAVVAIVLLAGCGSSGSGSSTDTSTATSSSTATAAASAGVKLGPSFGSMTSLPGVLTTPPPWPNNTGKLQQRLRAIGLDPLTAEGQVLHIHQHLDLFAAGRHVTVPANIGIDASGRYLAALHTHDSTGIMHVESPTEVSYTLGQFFGVWGVRLDARCIGGLCASGAKRLQTWVNGKPVAGDPTRIILDEHQEIVLAYGTTAQVPKPLPKSYDFAAVGL
jgi:hypothetical protein